MVPSLDDHGAGTRTDEDETARWLREGRAQPVELDTEGGIEVSGSSWTCPTCETEIEGRPVDISPPEINTRRKSTRFKYRFWGKPPRRGVDRAAEPLPTESVPCLTISGCPEPDLMMFSLLLCSFDVPSGFQARLRSCFHRPPPPVRIAYRLQEGPYRRNGRKLSVADRVGSILGAKTLKELSDSYNAKRVS